MSLSSCRAVALLAAAVVCCFSGAARSAAPPVLGMTTTAEGSLMFGVGVNADSGLTGSIVLNERNFDGAQDSESARPRLIPATAKIVSDVIIQGNRLVSTETIRNQMKTRPGNDYDPNEMTEDVRALYKTGQFGNVYADKKEDGPGRVKVYLYVRDNPNVIQKITFQGNLQLSKDDLESVTSLRAGMPLNPIVNKVACSRIVQRYNEEGRPFAACDLIKGADPHDTEVVFNINEGPQTRVASVSFTGNTSFSSADLVKYVSASPAALGIGAAYNSVTVDKDEKDLTAFYRSGGFYDVRVTPALKFSDDGHSVDVTFHVVEGVQYRLADAPKVVGVKSMPAEALEALDKVKAGDVYKQADVDGDTTRIKDYPSFWGHEVRIVAVPVDTSATPSTVEPKPSPGGQIIIVGSERTRQEVRTRVAPAVRLLTAPADVGASFAQTPSMPPLSLGDWKWW